MGKQFWEDDEIVTDEQPVSTPVQQPAQAQRPVQSDLPSGAAFIPNTGYQLDRQAKQIGIDKAQVDMGRDARNEDRSRANDAFSHANTVRMEYAKLPAISAYSVAIQQLAQAMQTAPNGSGDTSLIYAYAKAMDPESVVRESEMGMAQAGQSVIESKVAKLKKELGVEGGGGLSNDMRARMRGEIINSVKQRRLMYDQTRSHYSDLASRYGLNPEEIIGPDAGAPYVSLLSQFDNNGKRLIEQTAHVDAMGNAIDGSAGSPPSGPTVLPTASGAHEQGSGFGGVTPKGSDSAFSPIPKLRGLGNHVAGMIQRGASLRDVLETMNQHYREHGFQADAGVAQALQGIIERHRKNPSVPVKQFSDQWGNLEGRMEAGNQGVSIIGRAADSAPGAFAIGAANGVSLGFLDEAMGLVNPDKGAQAYAAMQESANERPGATLAGTLAGSLMLPTKVPGAMRAGEAAALARGATAMEAGAAGRAAASTRMMQEGAAYGAASGFGNAEGDFAQRLDDAAIGGVLGAGFGRATGKAGELVGKWRDSHALARSERGPSPAQDIWESGQRQGIDVMAGDLNPHVGKATQAAIASNFASPPILSAAARQADQAASAVQRIANRTGVPQAEREAMGQMVTEAASKGVKQTKAKAQSLYGVVENATSDIMAQPRLTYDELAQHIGELTDTGLNTKGVAILEGLANRMEQGMNGVAAPIRLSTLMKMRSQLRDSFAAEGLRATDIERRGMMVMDTLDKEIDGIIRSTGRDDVLRTWRQANQLWRSYAEATDKILGPIIGKQGERSGEQVVTALMTDLRSNNARAVKLLNTMDAQDQNNVRASIIAQLGRASDGNQNADGTAFSMAKFLTDWNKMGETAKLAYFGKEARIALNDIAKVAEGTKRSQAWANRSNSGNSVVGAGEIYGAVQSFGRTAISAYAMGKLLASPRFAKWLAGSTRRPNPAAVRDHVKRLAGIARAEPAIAEQVAGLQQHLQQVLKVSPSGAFAEGQDVQDAR